MNWVLGLFSKHWLFLCLGCASWFMFHTALMMIEDIRSNRRKLRLRRRALSRFSYNKNP